MNDMIGMWNVIESQMNDPYVVQGINGGTINGAMKILIIKLQKVSIRRMMSHYWETALYSEWAFKYCWGCYPAGHIHTKDG